MANNKHSYQYQSLVPTSEKVEIAWSHNVDRTLRNHVIAQIARSRMTYQGSKKLQENA